MKFKKKVLILVPGHSHEFYLNMPLCSPLIEHQIEFFFLFPSKNLKDFVNKKFFFLKNYKNVNQFTLDDLENKENNNIKFNVNYSELFIGEFSTNQLKISYKYSKTLKRNSNLHKKLQRDYAILYKFVSKIKPNLIFYEVPNYFITKSLYSISRKLKIKSVFFIGNPILNHQIAYEEIGKPINLNFKIKNELEEKYFNTIEKIRKNYFSYYSNDEKENKFKNNLSFNNLIKSFLKYLATSPFKILGKYEKPFSYLNYSSSFYKFIMQYHHYKNGKSYKNINLNFLKDKRNKYCFFLHASPEFTIHGMAPFSADQFNLIINISLSLPDDSLLIVKEHPNQFPFFGINELSKILNMPNIRFVPPYYDNKLLMKKSRMIFSISGTMLFESFVNNIKAISFSDSEYNFLPTVKKVTDFNNLKKIITNFSKVEITQDQINEHLNKYFVNKSKNLLPVDSSNDINSIANLFSKLL